ncbi:MAG: DUF4845 domain-containing protein [Steroidobacteraceae bacterium]
MYRKQRGITFLGGLILAIPIAIVVYAAIRLTPVYLNYMRVARSLELTASSVSSASAVSPQLIRNSLARRFDVESITFPTIDDIAIHQNGGSWVLEAKYEDTAHLFGNVSLIVDFDKISPIGG